MTDTENSSAKNSASILYCHCAFARVVPAETKQAVLKSLVDSNIRFEAVADLCEMSARKSNRLKELCGHENLRIAACYPRAVKWLLAAADVELPDSAHVANMRTDQPDAVFTQLTTEQSPSLKTEV